MIVIPAIDLKGGKCVRLVQGRKEDSTVYSDDPVATALKWEAMGASLLHLVDLDGAFTGDQLNFESIMRIRRAVKMDIEVGGGIRTMARIDHLLSEGINKVILGTAAIERPDLVREACRKYPGRIIVGIDAKDGAVAVKGWVEVTTVDAGDLAVRMQDLGAAGIIYTDISTDGTLSGPNIEAITAMVEGLRIPVIASGGVSSIEDIRRLAAIPKLWGAITGKALYAGTLDLREAIKAASGRC